MKGVFAEFALNVTAVTPTFSCEGREVLDREAGRSWTTGRTGDLFLTYPGSGGNVRGHTLARFPITSAPHRPQVFTIPLYKGGQLDQAV